MALRLVSVKIGAYTFTRADYYPAGDDLFLAIGDPGAQDGEDTPEGHFAFFARDEPSRLVALEITPARERLEREGHITVTLPGQGPVRLGPGDLAEALGAGTRA